MDLKTLTEYIKLHKISLIQDIESIEEHEITHEGYSKEYLQGAIDTCIHLLEYINER